jgi:hypothetical protein
MRLFLRNAIPLYRMRGTALGLKARLAIVCGVVPEIIEGRLPRSVLTITDRGEAEAQIFETTGAENYFTIYFPVKRESFSDDTLRRLSLAARKEKPAHMVCCISFAPAEKKRRKITAIHEDTLLNAEGGFFI